MGTTEVIVVEYERKSVNENHTTYDTSYQVRLVAFPKTTGWKWEINFTHLVKRFMEDKTILLRDCRRNRRYMIPIVQTLGCRVKSWSPVIPPNCKFTLGVWPTTTAKKGRGGITERIRPTWCAEDRLVLMAKNKAHALELSERFIELFIVRWLERTHSTALTCNLE